MIVEPGFPDHFKTQALVKLTKDESAPLAVLRLWGHCQNSRRWQFPDMTAEQLAALCAWGNRKPSCHTALIKAGYLKRLPNGGFEAHQWDERNGKLIANWMNGPRGGRPKKGQKNNPTETNGLKNENPGVTRGFSVDNPPETDKRREEKIRVHDPKRSGGTGEGVEGGTRWVVPRFDAVPAGTFRRELVEMVAGAREQVRKVKGDESAWVMSERVDEKVVDDIEWTNAELLKAVNDPVRKKKLEWDLKMLEGRRVRRVRSGLTAEASAVVSAWTKRIADLERALSGARE